MAGQLPGLLANPMWVLTAVCADLWQREGTWGLPQLELCYRLNCVPPPPTKFMVKSERPGPQNVTIFGDRIFKEIIKG